MLDEKQVEALKAPLARAHVKSRLQAGRSLSYIESWHAIAEANRIFGFDGWSSETDEIRCVSERPRKIGKGQYEREGWGVTYTARVRVRIGDVTREGCGAGHGIDVDLGLAHESAIKEAESDARKRALMTFGNPFGLALYDKDQANVTNETGTKTTNQKFGGPLTKTELKKQMRAFAGDLAACSDHDELVALLNTSKDLLDQCMRDLPDWFYGTDEQPGAQARIEEARKMLEPEQTVLGAG